MLAYGEFPVNVSSGCSKSLLKEDDFLDTAWRKQDENSECACI